jgi:hypothetical protein
MVTLALDSFQVEEDMSNTESLAGLIRWLIDCCILYALGWLVWAAILWLGEKLHFFLAALCVELAGARVLPALELAALWREFKEPFLPFWRFLGSHSQAGKTPQQFDAAFGRAVGANVFLPTASEFAR